MSMWDIFTRYSWELENTHLTLEGKYALAERAAEGIKACWNRGGSERDGQHHMPAWPLNNLAVHLKRIAQQENALEGKIELYELALRAIHRALEYAPDDPKASRSHESYHTELERLKDLQLTELPPIVRAQNAVVSAEQQVALLEHARAFHNIHREEWLDSLTHKFRESVLFIKLLKLLRPDKAALPTCVNDLGIPEIQEFHLSHEWEDCLLGNYKSGAYDSFE